MNRHSVLLSPGTEQTKPAGIEPTVKQDLARQLDALTAAGIKTIFSDKKAGATTARAGLQDAIRHARAGDVQVGHTLDRLRV
jgi:DNA invertase Pin-like site-specific DNA recombinase